MIDIAKMKEAALASLNHTAENYYSHVYKHTNASNPAAVLELITRLEKAELDAANWQNYIERKDQLFKAALDKSASLELPPDINY